jgi:flagellar biosynthesis protein FliP
MFRNRLSLIAIRAFVFTIACLVASTPSWADPQVDAVTNARPKLPAPMPPAFAPAGAAADQAVGEKQEANAPRQQNAGLAGVEQLLSPSGLTPTLKVMILLSLLSVAPAVLVMTTSFVRFVIVFGLLRQALGTQQLPPNQVVMSLSLFLTLFVMTPVWKAAYHEGIQPYVDEKPIPNLQPGEEPLSRVMQNTFKPVRHFMSEQIHKAHGEDIVWMLIDFRRPDPNSLAAKEFQEPTNFDDVEPAIIVTAYMLSELKAAFILGFQIFLPFLVIDFVVSTLLTSMGMMMMPPTLVSLPFKILLFVLIDGWTLVTHMLLTSVSG